MSNQWDKYAKIFDEGIGDGDEELHRDYIDPVIFGFLGNKKLETVVDAGCGNGYLIKKLAGLAAKVIGLDYSKDLLKAAKNRIGPISNVELLEADLARKLPIKDESVDVIIANMVLQYVPTLETFSGESYRILKPGGTLIVLVDHPGHYLYARAQELAGKKDPHFIDTGSYFKEGQRRKNSLWNKVVLEYFHRPVSGYIKPFLKDFKLTDMVENTQNGEMPRILGLKFVK